ncbi:MAG: hypothetical protein VX614_08820 [Myxococcota bacterium]|nr:hypothetical protein [Myxococcota bacterium]
MVDSAPQPPVPEARDPGAEIASTPETLEQRRSQNRWLLIRDTLVFQAKMLLEGIRDLVLVPLTLLAAGLGLARGGPEPQRYLLEVMRTARRFDRWLALFRPVEREFSQPPGESERASADTYLRQLEQVLIEQHERGGITAQVKQKVDHLLDGLEKTTSRTQRHVTDRFGPPAPRPRETDPVD